MQMVCCQLLSKSKLKCLMVSFVRYFRLTLMVFKTGIFCTNKVTAMSSDIPDPCVIVSFAAMDKQIFIFVKGFTYCSI